LISVLEAEVQQEGIAIAHAVSFEALGLGLIAALIALNPEEVWVQMGILAGGGFVLIYGVIASLVQWHSSTHRNAALNKLYDARRELAARPWWRRVFD